VRAGAYTESEIDHYVAGLLRPGRLTAALNYYRAAARFGARAPRPVRTDAPTLVIWGEQDAALTTVLLEGLDRFAPQVRIERIPTSGHWVQNEEPEMVNRLLVEFLRPTCPRAAESLRSGT
jgi:pimeloyl-ACP methyl ester carboxylesterase